MVRRATVKVLRAAGAAALSAADRTTTAVRRRWPGSRGPFAVLGHETASATVRAAAGRLCRAGAVRRPVGRQLFRAELDPSRAQHLPSRTAAVRGRQNTAAAAAAVRNGSTSASVRRAGETRELSA